MDENLDPNMPVEDMLRSRRPIDEVVDAIVSLCNEAMRDLPYMSGKEETHKLYFNKEATATLKALTLLYAASPLFNGNTMFHDFTNVLRLTATRRRQSLFHRFLLPNSF